MLLEKTLITSLKISEIKLASPNVLNNTLSPLKFHSVKALNDGSLTGS